MINGITRNSLGSIQKLRSIQEALSAKRNVMRMPKRFLMATRFVYAKGLDLMMQSFAEIPCKQDDEWELDIIGDGGAVG